jgi:hypothetical protein
MRPSVLGLLLPLFLGCSGQNVVAGEEKTKAAQLEASAPSWCESTCSRLLDCASTTPCQCNGDVCDCLGVDESCPTRCKATLGAFTHAGEACAAIGERLTKCIDRATCDDLGHDDPCPLTAAERAACPEPDGVDGGSDAPPAAGPNYGYAGSASAGEGPSGTGGSVSYGGSTSTGGGPSGTAGSVGYAGSANLAGAASGGASSDAGPPVSCSESYGAGGGQPQDGSSHVTCEEGRSGCSGGHEYAWLCSEDSQGHRACSCFVDSEVTGAFALTAACPALPEVNAGCDWNLTQ